MGLNRQDHRLTQIPAGKFNQTRPIVLPADRSSAVRYPLLVVRDAGSTLDAAIVLADGHRIYFDSSDERGNRLFAAGGNLNPHSLSLWQRALDLRPWGAVVDVGCNYGEMIVGSRLPEGAHVIAFEPNPRVLPYLERTLEEYSRPVDLIRAAVAARVDRNAHFAADTDWSGTSTLINADRPPLPHEHVLTVEVTTLDQALLGRGYSSACVKVDVEGWETDVLLGAQALLSRLDHWALMIEILHMPTHQISELAQEYNLYVFDTRCQSLIRLYGGNRDLVKSVLQSGWAYAQDALLLSSVEMAKS